VFLKIICVLIFTVYFETLISFF